MFEWLNASKRVDDLDRSVSQSFARVKQDTDSLYQWVTFLHQQNQQLLDQNAALRRLADEQKMALNELKVTVQHLPKTPHEIKLLVDQFYSFEPILSRIKHIEQRIELIDVRREHIRPLVHNHPSVSSERPVEKQSSSALKEKLMRKLARNSKEYIKNLVLGLVHKYGKMGAMQLREMVVEEQGLCSKSSFYRILQEMEEESSLQVASDGRNTVYIASATRAA